MMHEQGKSIGQTERHGGVLKWNTMSRNTIKIVFRPEFDLAIAQSQIKVKEDNIPTKGILSCFNMNTTRNPFKKEQSRIEILPFNSPSCCLSSTN